MSAGGERNSAPLSPEENKKSEKDAKEYEIEEIYELIGFGCTQWIVLLVSGLNLLMVLNETLGMSIVTIASQCDFQTSSVDKALMTSTSFMGIVCTSYMWGYLSDIFGRRNLLIYTTLMGNLFSFTSMFIPTFWPFIIIRFFVGCCIAGASSIVYAYLGEFFTARLRPIVINYASMFVGISMIYSAGISWLVLSMDWSLQISADFIFRPWRLILLSYFLPGLTASLILLTLPDSPKFLLSVQKHDEAYKAVDWVSRHSKGGKSLAERDIFKLKMDSPSQQNDLFISNKGLHLIKKIWRDTKPLFQRPYVIHFLISCTVMMGLFLSSSGMGLWYPTIQNRVSLTEQGSNYLTVCEILEGYGSTMGQNNTIDYVCNDHVTEKSLIDTMILGFSYVVGYLILGVVINPIGRKVILIGFLALSGVFAFVLLWIRQPTAVVISFIIFLLLPGLSISMLSGGVVDLMPTYLRGKAVCICLMLGRGGSVIGSNIIGALLETNCMVTFSIFGAFGLMCSGLMFLLPI